MARSTANAAVGGQEGAALLETVVTLDIVGAVAVTFLTGLVITARSGPEEMQARCWM